MDSKAVGQSKWGRSRFGGGSGALIAVSLSAGAVLSAGAGVLFARLNAPEHFVLAALLMAAGLLPVLSTACWALLLDRDTLRGATRNPEISVESQWYDRAAIGVFQDLLLVCGLGGAVFSFIQIQASLGLVLAGVVLLALLDFGIRYFIIKRAES
ncbi:hypothetical protein M2368_003771 [Arthrobacter sp. JUb119]|uniref:hypothetical protein n=1 Tax=Micrococcaceae TaxID=1268 RepID=UPI000CFD203A|nr:hypothetical protein [Arthrobacter sp. MYb222]MCS3494739.1 hypothetical protein [Arthrobacter sp. JUb119]PQZ84617.1 hypothetical protein CQ016_15740 [Arthrobacter sp. MYb222]